MMSDCSRKAWDVPRCERGKVGRLGHLKAPEHIDIEPAYEGMDLSQLQTISYGDVDFGRLDPDEVWEMRRGRIVAIVRGGVRFVPERPRDWDCPEVD